MKILITGGFEYIGGRLAQYLFEQGHDICLGTRIESSSQTWLPGASVVQTRWIAGTLGLIVCLLHRIIKNNLLTWRQARQHLTE